MLNIGLGGQPIEVAADRLRISVQPGAEDDVDQALDAQGLCLRSLDHESGRGTVQLPPSVSLESAVRQLAAVEGIASVQVDPLMSGADGGHHHGHDCDDDDDDDDDHGGGHHGHDHDDDDDHDGHDHDDDDDDDFEGPSLWHLAAIKLGGALERQPDAAGITVALLDTGLTAGPGLEGATILPGYDFINDDGDASDDNGHGTMIAGILASDGEYPGVAPGVGILPIKVLDNERLGSEGALVDGIDFAVAQGADIISMSLAFPPGYIPSYELSDAIHRAYAAGAVLIAASGNHGTGEIGYPAAFGEVIAVGGGRMAKHFHSLDAEDALRVEGDNIARKVRKAEYSGWGAGIDLLAPGGSIDHDLDGDGFPDAVPVIGFTEDDPTHAGYLMAGTSPATVQVAGIAALLLADGATRTSLLPLMTRNATPIKPHGFDIYSGSGIVDAKESVKQLEKNNIPSTPKYYVNPIVTIATDTDGKRRAIAMVEVIDDENEPVPGVKVLAHFRGPVTHAAEATTDALGRGIMVSYAGTATSDIFEFGVDKIISCPGKGKHHHHHHHGHKPCKNEVITIPGTYAQFEEMSFRFFAAFDPGGSGIEPQPFMIFIPNDVISPIVADFSLSGTPGAPPVVEPVSTIPTDLSSYAIVESLLVRSFGAAGGKAPVVFTVAKSVLTNGCAITEGGTPVRVVGGGIEPQPFRIGEDVLGLPPSFNSVITRSDGGLFLNGNPTTEAGLGLLTGTTGVVMISVDGSVCVPQSRPVGGMEVFSTPIRNGMAVTDGGFTYVGDIDPLQPPSSLIDLEDTALRRAVGQGLISSAAMGGAQASAAVVDP